MAELVQINATKTVSRLLMLVVLVLAVIGSTYAMRAYIGSTMAEARREEALQTLPMLPLQIRYERLLVA